MSKKNTSRATKLVLASLLATSVAFPTVSSAEVSSNQGESQAVTATSEEQNQQVVINVADLPNGIYTVKAKYLNEKDLSKTSTMGNYFSDKIIIKVKDGVATADLSVKFDFPAILAVKYFKGKEKVSSDVTAKTIDGSNKVFTLPIVNIGENLLVNAEIDYSKSSAASQLPPGFDPLNNHNFVVAIDAKTLETPGTIVTYKAEHKEEKSIMNSYTNPGVKISVVDGGFEVQMSYSQGQYVKGMKVEGKEATLVKASTAADKTAIYKFVVPSIKDYINAEIDLDIPGVYKQSHEALIKLSAKDLQPFTDLPNNWAKDYITNLYANGIFVQDSKFRPAAQTKRYEFALMVQRTFNFENTADKGFKDLPKLAEAIDAINALANNKIINGTSDTTFSPSETIKRQDAAIMIYRLLEHYGLNADVTATSQFPDVTLPANPTDYQKEIYTAVTQLAKYQIIVGDEKGKFNPTQSLTREQMAKVLYIATDVINQQKNKSTGRPQ